MGTETSGPSQKEMGLDKLVEAETKQDLEKIAREYFKSPEGTDIGWLMVGALKKRLEDNDKRERFIDDLEELRAELKGVQAEIEIKFGEEFSVVFPEAPKYPEISGRKLKDVLDEVIRFQMGEE